MAVEREREREGRVKECGGRRILSKGRRAVAVDLEGSWSSRNGWFEAAVTSRKPLFGGQGAYHQHGLVHVLSSISLARAATHTWTTLTALTLDLQVALAERANSKATRLCHVLQHGRRRQSLIGHRHRSAFLRPLDATELCT